MGEWSLLAADTYLAAACEAGDTTLQFGHDSPSGSGRYPSSGALVTAFWATLNPDNPADREELLVTSMTTGGLATCTRGYLAHPHGAAKAHKPGTPVRLGTRAGAIPEGWHLVDTAGEPAFQGTWGNLGGAFAGCRFRRTPEGLVILGGTLANGTGNTVAYQLPLGYRPGTPAGGTFIFVHGGNRVDLGTSGNVIPQVGPGSTGLDTIRFQADG
jgi:hypothetical protein